METEKKKKVFSAKRDLGYMRGSILCNGNKCGVSRRSAKCSCGETYCHIRLQWKKKIYRYYTASYGRPFLYKDAQAVLNKINDEITAGTFNPEKWKREAIAERKLGTLWDAWIAEKIEAIETGKFSPSTLKSYNTYRRKLEPLESTDVRKITKEELNNLPKKWGKTSGKYQWNIFNCLRAFLNWAIQKGHMKTLPEFPECDKEPAKKQQALDYNGQQFHINEIPDKHRDIYIFASETALRIGEACAVMIEDLDLPNERMIVQRTYSASQLMNRPKGKKKLWIPLSDKAIEVAKRNIRSRIGRQFLFINPETNNGYKTGYLRKLWRKHSTCALTLHEAIRATTVTGWAVSGANAFEIKDLGRWSDIRTAEGYVRASTKHLRNIVNRRNVVKFENPAKTNQEA